MHGKNFGVAAIARRVVSIVSLAQNFIVRKAQFRAVADGKTLRIAVFDGHGKEQSRKIPDQCYWRARLNVCALLPIQNQNFSVNRCRHVLPRRLNEQLCFDGLSLFESRLRRTEICFRLVEFFAGSGVAFHEPRVAHVVVAGVGKLRLCAGNGTFRLLNFQRDVVVYQREDDLSALYVGIFRHEDLFDTPVNQRDGVRQFLRVKVNRFERESRINVADLSFRALQRDCALFHPFHNLIFAGLIEPRAVSYHCAREQHNQYQGDHVRFFHLRYQLPSAKIFFCSINHGQLPVKRKALRRVPKGFLPP